MSTIAIVTATDASLWHELQERAGGYAKAEAVLQPMLERYVLGRRDFGDGLARRISERITASMSEATSIGRVCCSVCLVCKQWLRCLFVVQTMEPTPW